MPDGDHLDLIRIHGLESADTELFQGTCNSAETDNSTNTETTAQAQDWGDIPEEARTEIQTYFEAVRQWWEQATADRSLSKSRALPMLRPVVPLVLATATIASGGTLTLPAIGITLLAQVGMSLIDGIMGEVAKLVVPDELEDILEKALLSDDQSILKLAFLKDDVAILETALLYVEDEKTKSVLNERLKEIAGVDIQVETNDIKITSAKHGVIEYV